MQMISKKEYLVKKWDMKYKTDQGGQGLHRQAKIDSGNHSQR